MARTAPAPDVPPLPGMCPHVVVKAGGGAGGGGGGRGAGSGGGASGGGPGGGGSGAGGGGAGAAGGSPNGDKYKKAAIEGEPVDAVTGRVWTLPVTELFFRGPLDLSIQRTYSSAARHRDIGLGPGWTHSLAWRIQLTHLRPRIWTGNGVWVELGAVPDDQQELVGAFGWSLRRSHDSWCLDTGDGLFRHFEALTDPSELVLTACTDRFGNRITLRYDGGRLVEIVDAVGRRVRLRHDDRGHVIAIEALNAPAQGQWIGFARYRYDSAGDLVEAVDADGHASRYRYDRHLLIEHVDRVGLCMHYRYDRQARCIESWGDYLDARDESLDAEVSAVLADGSGARGIYHLKLAHYPDGYTELVTASAVKRFHGNAFGLIDKVADDGRVSTAEYDALGLVIRETNELGHTTTYERDDRGRLLAEIDPLGRTTRYALDERGGVAQISHPHGAVTTVERDERLLPRMVRHADGTLESFRWDERGQLVERTERDGATTRIRRDAHGNMVERHARSGVWRYRHDFFGRLVEKIDPYGARSVYRYSTRGDLAYEELPTGASCRYTRDGEGRLTRRIGPRGEVEQLRWGGFHRLVETTDAAGRSVGLRYDREGNLLSVYNEKGERHRFFFDAARNLVREETFDGRVTTYRYDSAGHVTRIDRAGDESVELVYNAAGELVERTFHDGSAERFLYDERGLITGIEADAVALAFERDDNGRIVRQRFERNGERSEVTLAYDELGRVVRRRTTEGHELDIARDDGGRERWMLDGMNIAIERDAFRREISRRLPRGALLTSRWDLGGRLESRALSAEQNAFDTRYEHDTHGLVAAHDSAWGSTRITRDILGRLLEVTRDNGNDERFAWDATDNVLEEGIARSHGMGNRLLRRGDTVYQYDDAGRLILKRSGAREWRYRYDAKGLLSEVDCPDGILVRFRYDPLERRTDKLVFERRGTDRELLRHTRFRWDRHLLVHESTTSFDGRPDQARTYVFEEASFVPCAQVDRTADGTTRCLHYVNDANGTPLRLIDDAGNTVADMRTTAWGRVLDETSAEASPIRFQGQYHDVETGLHYNRHRYFDPETGRFITPDPSGLGPDLNVYARGRDPFDDVDPTGYIVTQVKPAKLSPQERAARREAGRQAFNEDPAAQARAKNIKSPTNASKCMQVADEACANGGGRPVALSVEGPDDAYGSPPLKTTDRDTGKPKNWDNHYVNEEPDGSVVDYDQGVKFGSRQEYIDAMFDNDENINTQKIF